MPSIRDIKRRICELGPADFQEFCDTFLYKKGYENILGYGMKAGTGKTTKGNPDTYARNKNGKYTFVAYTMQDQGVYPKIKEDIEKCLDVSKTGIEPKNIEEIICCYTSSNLSAGDEDKLYDLCQNHGVSLTLYSVDKLANEVCSKYRSLGEYLGVGIDTNQILQVDDFVIQYDANGMSAPLGTKFQFRNTEKDEIRDAISGNRAVIVTGRAGVGKTRLVLEAVREYSIDKGYMLLCVKNNNLGLYNDLVSATEHSGKYLFFIDDANELAELRQILAFITKDYLGYEVKVIVTVRDYAKTNVIKDIRDFTNPYIIQLKTFTDEEIKGFLDENLGIRNSEYVDKIVAISEGNPRIAYMAGKLAKEESLSAIKDVSQLYEAYYKSRVDDAFGEDKDLCFTAGILAVINAVVLSDLSALQGILMQYGISDDVFKNKIRQLAQIEVVEIHLDQVATLSDQCLANYMLYYVFFQRKILPLGDVLETGYKSFRNGVIRSVNTILNIFETDATKEYCREEVLKTWKKLKESNDTCFEKFVEDFHVFKAEEGFLLAKERIDRIKQEQFYPMIVDFSKNEHNINENILSLLEGYYCSDFLNYVVELLIDYCGKSVKTLITGYKWLENNYGIEADSYRYAYYTQRKIGEELLHFMELGNVIAMALGMQWAKYALRFYFSPVGSKRGNTFCVYHIEMRNSKGVEEYRQYCWNILLLLSKRSDCNDSMLSYLEEYSRSLHGDTDYEIINSEIGYIEEILNALDCDRVRFLKVIERLQHNLKKCNTSLDKKWNHKLRGNRWNLYKLFEDEYISSELEYDDYKEYREKRIIDYARGVDKKDIYALVHDVNEIVVDLTSTRDVYEINQGFGLLVQNIDKEILVEFLDAYIKAGNDLSLSPWTVLVNINRDGKSDDLFKKLNKEEYPQKNEWLFVFFDTLPKETIDKKWLNELLAFLESDSDKNIISSGYRRLRFLDKFIDVEPNIYPVACSIIYNKRHYNSFMVEIYFGLLFHKQIYSPKELLKFFEKDEELLQDIYFYTLSGGRLEDYTGEFLQEFIGIDDAWLQRYSDMFWDDKSKDDYQKSIVLWKSDNYIKYFDYIFDSFPREGVYEWQLTNRFSEMLVHTANDEKVKQRQEDWIIHQIRLHSHDQRILAIFEIVSELNEELRRKALGAFLKENDSYETFKELQLTPNHWSGTDSFVPAYQNQIVFLESLYSLVDGIKFLKHKMKIQERVEWLKSLIKKEEVEVIYRHLYM